MRYEFPSLPAVSYLMMATDLKRWIWITVAAAMIGLGLYFDLNTVLILSQLMILLLAALIDGRILKKINASQTQARFDRLSNLVISSLLTIDNCLLHNQVEKERVKMLQPLLNLLTDPSYTDEERKILVKQLPPLTLSCFERYCQSRLEQEQAVINAGLATPREKARATEDAFCLQAFIGLVEANNNTALK